MLMVFLYIFQVMAGYDSNDGRQNPDLKVPDYMASVGIKKTINTTK